MKDKETLERTNHIKSVLDVTGAQAFKKVVEISNHKMT